MPIIRSPLGKPSWTPSPALIARLRTGIDDLDRQLTEMRACPPLGDDDLDTAWQDGIDAYQEINDSIRRALGAEDWPALLQAARNRRAMREQEGQKP